MHLDHCIRHGNIFALKITASTCIRSHAGKKFEKILYEKSITCMASCSCSIM